MDAMADPTIIAVRGATTLLVDAGTTVGETGPGAKLARVFEATTGTLFPPFAAESIVSRGYWTKPDLVEPALLAGLTEELKTALAKEQT